MEATTTTTTTTDVAEDPLSSRALLDRFGKLRAALVLARVSEETGAYWMARNGLKTALSLLQGDGILRVTIETKLGRMPEDAGDIEPEELADRVRRELARFED